MRKQSWLLQLLQLLLYIGIITTFSGCIFFPDSFTPIDELNIPDNFDYKTTSLVQIQYDFGTKYPVIPIGLYASEYSETAENQTSADLLIGYGITDENGKLETAESFPDSYAYLVLKPGYIGLPSEIRIPVDLEKTIAAKKGAKAVEPVETFSTLRAKDREPGASIKLVDNYWWFMNDTYSNRGKPASITNVLIEDALLKDINNSVFKYSREKSSDQAYLDSLEVGTLQIENASDIWVTFIHETAGFSNSFGYYTYKTSEGRPAVITDQDITLMFPNASYEIGDKGALNTGDSVFIGNFEAGISLGFVVIANGWYAGTGSNPIGRVRESGHQGLYYSENALNPEVEADARQHAAIVYHEGEEVFILGMEDNKHTATDYNFNDLIFAIVVEDPASVGNLADIPSIAQSVDNDFDDDGVIDSLDAYPDDPLRTSVGTVSGTLAYEDLWPSIGDYDFNDLVIGYSYQIDGNARNEIVSIEFTYTILASGAGFPDGLALSLPLDTDEYAVSSLIFSNTSEEAVAERTQFPETNGSRVLIFKTQNEVMQYDAKPNPFNTGGNLELAPQSVTGTITFSTPIGREILGEIPYDVFLLADNAESDTNPDKANREVHLPHFPPTPLANQSFFNTYHDTTDISLQRYYKSANNLPWAIHIPGDWSHPLERKSIVEAYNYFGAWAESGGTQYADWYQAKQNYLNTENLF